jgi:ATP-dependent helicase/DNAse subunit B
MGDFVKCPRAYFLHNVYKNKNGRKINITTPAMSLGIAVHAVLEPLAQIKAEQRMSQPLFDLYEKEWKKVTGKRGGFLTQDEENEAKDRGKNMLERVIAHPEPLIKKALRMKEELPWYYLSEKDDLILCGKVDWMQYVPEDDSVHILDFKTGKHDEKGESLQLPIYHLLMHNCQKRKVSGASYWYIDRDDEPKAVELPNLEDAYKRVYEVAIQVKKARDAKVFECPTGGCVHCAPFEAILAGKAEYVGVGEYNQDLYIFRK